MRTRIHNNGTFDVFGPARVEKGFQLALTVSLYDALRERFKNRPAARSHSCAFRKHAALCLHRRTYLYQ